MSIHRTDADDHTGISLLSSSLGQTGNFMRIIVAVVALGVCGPTALALTADYTVHQKGRTFSSDITTVRKGQIIVFLNDDTVPHNIFSTSTGNEFNLGSQRPGLSTDVTFSTAGEVEIVCAIHPRMRMTIVVAEH